MSKHKSRLELQIQKVDSVLFDSLKVATLAYENTAIPIVRAAEREIFQAQQVYSKAVTSAWDKHLEEMRQLLIEIKKEVSLSGKQKEAGNG